MNTCKRCGITDARVLDIGTGSACHPELGQCIAALRAEQEMLVAALESLRPMLNTCGDAENCLHGIRNTAAAKREIRYVQSKIAAALLALEPKAAEAAGGEK